MVDDLRTGSLSPSSLWSCTKGNYVNGQQDPRKTGKPASANPRALHEPGLNSPLLDVGKALPVEERVFGNA